MDSLKSEIDLCIFPPPFPLPFPCVLAFSNAVLKCTVDLVSHRGREQESRLLGFFRSAVWFRKQGFCAHIFSLKKNLATVIVKKKGLHSLFSKSEHYSLFCCCFPQCYPVKQ